MHNHTIVSALQLTTLADFVALLNAVAPTTPHMERARTLGGQFRQWLCLHGESPNLTRLSLTRLDALMNLVVEGDIIGF